MFNVRQLYSIPQFLRTNFQEANHNARVFSTIKEKKKWDLRFFDHVSCRILSEKYKHLCCNTTENYIISLKHRQRKVDLNASKESLVFVTMRHRKFYLYVQLSHTKISYLRKNTHLQKCCFLKFPFEEKFRKYYVSVKRKHRKLTKRWSFLPFSQIFLRRKFFSSCSEGIHNFTLFTRLCSKGNRSIITRRGVDQSALTGIVREW